LNFSSTLSIVSSGNSLFLSLKGSIEGEISTCGTLISFLANAGAEKMAESYFLMYDFKNSITSLLGLVKSM
jgi:hypothetical protein